jgi:hypothetical protein
VILDDRDWPLQAERSDAFSLIPAIYQGQHSRSTRVTFCIETTQRYY